jgi:hypothetical protein
MTTPTVTELSRNGNHHVAVRPQVGEPVELARYTVPGAGKRLVVGQRANGVVRLVDRPASGHGRAYLIERELEQDGYAALRALVSDYIEQARHHKRIPMGLPLDRYLEHVDP